jgi:hypothetical protein
VKTTILLLLTIVLMPFSLNAQASTSKKGKKAPFSSVQSNVKPNTTDTTSQPLNNKDSVKSVRTLRMSKDSLDAPVNYDALDSGVMIMKTKEFLLYGNARTVYKASQLEAANIVYDQQSQNIRAFGAKDTSGNPMSNPKFKEGTMVSVNDSIFFNMKSGKGLTKNTNFQQGEIYINANTMKKVSKDEAFAWKAKFTTCNLDEPHFAFVTNKMKIVSERVGVSGPIHPEFEGVPVPIEMPFAIFPLTRGKHSGLLAPAYTSSEDFGIGLEGLGYYKILSDNTDATLRTNLYSYGGWSANLNTKYIKRYKYLGNFNLTLQKTRILNRNTAILDEFTGGQTFMLNWSHQMDNRALPGTNFSANVNFGSSKFNSYLLNSPYQNFQNRLSSSISYSKSWNNKYNLSVNVNHSQNTNSKTVNVSLPNINFNMLTAYPFQKKDQVGSGKWYEKIGIGYNGSFQNQVGFYDTAMNLKKILDTMQWGATHSIPISVSLPSLGPVTLTPSVTFEDKWFGQSNFLQWNSRLNKLDTTITKGFFNAAHVTFGLGTASRIFGTYKVNGKNVVAIRHEIRPSISFNYTPDLASSYHYTAQIDSTGRTYRFSRFDGTGMGGAYSEGTFGGIGFGIDNLLEMKVRDKEDTSSASFKKIKLIEGFGFNSNYNFLADSFQLGNFNFYARTMLFNKINITSSFTLDPYATDNKGFRRNRLDIDPSKFKFGNITNGGISISTSFKSKVGSEKDSKKKDIPIDPFMTPDEQMRQLQYVKANPAEFTDFTIPWTLTLSYSLNFSRIMKPDYSGFKTQFFSSMNFSGDFSLTPKWKLGATGYVDVANLNIQQMSMFITREMHCWQLAINVTPIGLYKSFNITVNPKSGILRDLKINRSRTFSNSTY